jgi:DNA polymerase IIIc chi subunit
MGTYYVIDRTDDAISIMYVETGFSPDTEVAKWAAHAANATRQPRRFFPLSTASIPADIDRWFASCKAVGNNIVVDLTRAKKQRADELEKELNGESAIKDLPHVLGLIEKAEAEAGILLVFGTKAEADAAKQTAISLKAITKADLQTSCDAVTDLVTLDTHEPQTIKDAKTKMKAGLK